YVIDSNNNRLAIFDVSNPTSLVSIGSTTTGLNNSQNLSVQGRYAYVTSRNNSSLVVFDISNPYDIRSVTSTTTGLSTPLGISVSGRYAYEVDNTTGLNVFDLGGTYTQQLEAGSAEVGNLTVNTNGQVNGDFNIQGGLNVGSGLQIAGNVGINSGLEV